MKRVPKKANYPDIWKCFTNPPTEQEEQATKVYLIELIEDNDFAKGELRTLQEKARMNKVLNENLDNFPQFVQDHAAETNQPKQTESSHELVIYALYRVVLKLKGGLKKGKKGKKGGKAKKAAKDEEDIEKVRGVEGEEGGEGGQAGEGGEGGEGGEEATPEPTGLDNCAIAIQNMVDPKLSVIVRLSDLRPDIEGPAPEKLEISDEICWAAFLALITGRCGYNEKDYHIMYPCPETLSADHFSIRITTAMHLSMAIQLMHPKIAFQLRRTSAAKRAAEDDGPAKEPKKAKYDPLDDFSNFPEFSDTEEEGGEEQGEREEEVQGGEGGVFEWAPEQSPTISSSSDDATTQSSFN